MLILNFNFVCSKKCDLSNFGSGHIFLKTRSDGQDACQTFIYRKVRLEVVSGKRTRGRQSQSEHEMLP